MWLEGVGPLTLSDKSKSLRLRRQGVKRGVALPALS